MASSLLMVSICVGRHGNVRCDSGTCATASEGCCESKILDAAKGGDGVDACLNVVISEGHDGSVGCGHLFPGVEWDADVL